MDFATLVGVTGAGLLLIAFIATEFKKLKPSSFLYDTLNFSGAAFLVWYAVLLESVPFIILEGIWAVIVLLDVVKKLAEKGKNR